MGPEQVAAEVVGSVGHLEVHRCVRQNWVCSLVEEVGLNLGTGLRNPHSEP